MSGYRDVCEPTQQEYDVMTASSTLADLAVTHPGAARVFHRHGLDFCCGGRQPLATVCAERGLDADAVLADIDREGAMPGDERRWDLEPLTALIAFIVTTYHRRLREAFPDLVRMAATVEARHAAKADCPKGLAAQLTAMHDEVLEHLAKEEQVLFPLILSGQGRMAIGPVHVLEMEHEAHARNLQIVRQITHDLQPPAEACPTWRALYLQLQALEQELMVHIHLENHVLFSRALVE
jgi:regulator of cell morphogenesis and NO signaling